MKKTTKLICLAILMVLILSGCTSNKLAKKIDDKITLSGEVISIKDVAQKYEDEYPFVLKGIGYALNDDVDLYSTLEILDNLPTLCETYSTELRTAMNQCEKNTNVSVMLGSLVLTFEQLGEATSELKSNIKNNNHIDTSTLSDYLDKIDEYYTSYETLKNMEL